MSSWVVLMLNTKNQLPRLPRSGLKCNETRGVVVFLTDNNTTPTKVVFKLFWVVGRVVATDDRDK